MMDDVGEMTRERELLVLCFLEALVMLWFLREPDVVKDMTVSDWLPRTCIEGNGERTMVKVNQCDAFVLSEEEEAWFDGYYEYLRSVMIKKRHRRCSSDEVEKFSISSSGNPADNPSEDLKKLHDDPAKVPEPKWMNANAAVYLLKMSHPVTVPAAPPEKAAECTSQGNTRATASLFDTFAARQPSESRVHSWMENVPDAADVIKDWKPPPSIQAPTDSKSIRRMSHRQCWRGLQLMDREGKALGVVTSWLFVCGEVICDFHGRLISRDEGLQIHQNNEAQAGHLFFFTSKNGQDMCLDAHEERCDCYPNKSKFVRQIKHASKHASLSPRLHFVEDEAVIRFMVTWDIQIGEEICYDYRDHRRSWI